MTLLTAINAAQRKLSLVATSAVVADGQETQNLLWQLANDEAVEILERDEYDFPLLRRTQSFAASLASLQSAPGKPTDFQRAIPETFWNASQNRKVYGPLSDEEWAIANGNAVSSATWQSAMFRYDGLHIFPVPTVADTITYDYIINTPIQATGGGAYKTAFTSDLDEYLLGDRALRLGVVWRYLQTKGRDYAEDLKNYELAIAALARAQRGAPRALSIAPSEQEDTGFGA